MSDPYIPNLNPPIANFSNSGSGSPEGVAYNDQGKTYWDYLNNVLYVKDSSGFGNTGWVASTGAASAGQIVTYTSGTPANPSDISLPAIAYDPTGALPTLGWNTTTHTWN